MPGSLLRAIATLLASLPATTARAMPRDPPVVITLGRAAVPLVGPWKFHVGDDPHWADPAFDDAAWENVDLTPPPGAHDPDVGLTGYVPGWGARGHAGYAGYAWYRIHVSLSAPSLDSLALAGPPAVDHAYQAYLNGSLLGGDGEFSGATPTVHSIQPRMFALPRALARGGDMVLAVRVWMGPWTDGDREAGGMRIAPVLGETTSIAARYRLQWLQTFNGYVVEVVEAFFFVLLAGMALSLTPFDRADRAYRWLAAALLLTATYRANQAFFFWAQYETIRGFELFIVVLVMPLAMGAWMMAWREWLRVRTPAWLPRAAAILTLSYMLGQFLDRSWFQGVFPAALASSFQDVVTASRLGFVALFVLIACRGIRERKTKAYYALPAMLTIGVALFAQELSALHVPGIWFPFGTGVSRTQYAYAVFDVILFALLLRRLWSFAKPPLPSPIRDAA